MRDCWLRCQKRNCPSKNGTVGSYVMAMSAVKHGRTSAHQTGRKYIQSHDLQEISSIQIKYSPCRSHHSS
ncbi:hypothetical protein XELAEV_18008812mg [Xenopus laevis]|uniref:Uncharacterized protein n=1 Tax=Xenopus laevis TaxID=8355 RepID=A0A974I093_XENLA|nr:hypothetical protein XELAEV_18008812mg [Xenopus laevis]